MNESLERFAVGLARNDFAVLPLLPRTKRPRCPHGFLDATTDAELVAEHWRKHPRDNVGIRPPLGVLVLDIDPRNGGDVEMAKLVGQHGRLPATWVARTGGGGYHYWFMVGDLKPKAHLCTGVDVKTGDNGFVVAPPSVTSYRYRWLRPPVGDPAPAPPWLREALIPPKYEPPPLTFGTGDGSGQFSLHCLLARIDAAPEGSRNITVFGACRDAVKQGDLDAFEPALVSAALARGLTATEVAATVRSAARGPQ